MDADFLFKVRQAGQLRWCVLLFDFMCVPSFFFLKKKNPPNHHRSMYVHLGASERSRDIRDKGTWKPDFWKGAGRSSTNFSVTARELLRASLDVYPNTWMMDGCG